MVTTDALKQTKKNKNLTSIAYDTIKNSIINNEIKPGDYLSENSIAQILGMSRTPIREAIKVLASEGLVEIHNGVGVFVKHVTTKEIHELFEVRAALECTALCSSLKYITDDEINSIEKEWLELKSKVDKGEKIDLNIISEYDSRMHSLIIDRCDNEYLKEIMNSIRLKVLRFQRMSARALGNEKETINQHLEILNYMKKKDKDKLAKVLKLHIEKAAEYITKNPNLKY
ncbi:GntR family transcriptional regulator [Wukongibacter sp. M2B1]|uniref:GntR family transcriptional regulator n=1 Tax=Wukongibacter sp. M2B1 TaxID=3088895 RepID=UPI003D7AE6E2